MRIKLAFAALLAASASMPALAQATDAEREARREARQEARQADRMERGGRDAPAWQGTRAAPEMAMPVDRAERPERAPSIERPAAVVDTPPVERRRNVERIPDGGDRVDRDTMANAGREWRRNNAGTAQLGGPAVDPRMNADREARRAERQQERAADVGVRNDNWRNETQVGQARRNDAWRDGGQQGQNRRDLNNGIRNDAWRNDAWRNQQRGVDNRFGNNGYRSDNRNWNSNRSWSRDWRRDQRYDWQRYRYANRSLYRARPYYAPNGWSYGYRRFSIGFSLSNILLDQRYWINDPYSYRLPAAYEPYRWVRYYDDVLLVDLRSGQVVDVIHDFFW